MKNLEAMKKNLCDQIQTMSLETFNEFVEQLVEWSSGDEDAILDLSKMFKCSDCKKLYGSCPEGGTEECDRRFAEFANKEYIKEFFQKEPLKYSRDFTD